MYLGRKLLSMHGGIRSQYPLAVFYERIHMKKITLILTISFLFSMLDGVASGQVPDADDIVLFTPIVDFSEIFDDLSKWFGISVSELYVWAISVFFCGRHLKSAARSI